MKAPVAAAALLTAACSVMLPVAGYPPEALRKAPPPDIEQSALAVGAEAPPIALADTAGKPWSFPADGRKIVLLFYRGDW